VSPVNPDAGGDPDADAFWEAAAEGRLVYSECTACGRRWFPPRAICSACGGEAGLRDSAGRGEVVTWSRIHRSGDTGFAELVPYVVAVVALDEGVRLVANVEPVDAVAIGRRCTVTFRPSPATGRPAPLFVLEDA
jgi:uncharacterized OB-fold protein